MIIPEGVTSIGRDAFYGCEDLEIVVILDGVKEIGEMHLLIARGSLRW